MGRGTIQIDKNEKGKKLDTELPSMDRLMVHLAISRQKSHTTILHHSHPITIVGRRRRRRRRLVEGE